MGTVLILTAGTTAEPLCRALEEAHRDDPGLTVCVLYGRPFPGQQPSPLDAVMEVVALGRNLGVPVQVREVSDPEDIDVCLRDASAIVREHAGAERMVVNYTGGTKVLSAALVHAALQERIAGTLVLDYVGGPVRDATGRVLREAMRVRRTEQTATEELLRQVLGLLQGSAYREARFLARGLPVRGRASFVREAAEALYLWDEFDYRGATEVLRRNHRTAGVLGDDAELGLLARLLLRLTGPGNKLADLTRHLIRVQESGEVGSHAALEDMALLVADTLENGQRRLGEQRATDCVLRAYRAVEVAMQAALLAREINPWRPAWDRLDPALLKTYQERLGSRQLPPNLSLRAGLQLLKVLGVRLEEAKQLLLQDVQATRNHCYLEHGYRRVAMEDAARVLQYAQELAASLLDRDLEPLRELVRHRLAEV